MTGAGPTSSSLMPFLGLTVGPAGGVEKARHRALGAGIHNAVGLQLHEVEALLADAVGHDCPVLGLCLADDLACRGEL